MIYTSNFAKNASNPKAVSIARFPPKWFKGQCAFELAPKANMIRGLSHEEFRRRYFFEILDKLSAFDIAKKYDGKILLCFEKIGDYCHRQLVAEWLKRYGFECEELAEEEKSAPNVQPQIAESSNEGRPTLNRTKGVRNSPPQQFKQMLLL
jgi:hypothetical protein